MNPIPLVALQECSVMVNYDLEMCKQLLQELQPEIYTTIVIYPETPMWIMSPRSRIYLKSDIRQFKGYLNRFIPHQMKEDDQEIGGLITIKPVGQL